MAGDYSFLDRAIHRIVLGSETVRRFSFDLEEYPPEDDLKAASGRAVFVCGMARSGTTALLRLLFETSEFESLTYRDMPFVLMPRRWSRMTASMQKPAVLSERAHGDSIQVGFDSPEGFESVFWRTFPGDFARFRKYAAAIASRSGTRKRYLSKNNNNLIRLPALRREFPDASIVVLYRDPLQTAASSCRQHLHFCEEQRRNPFVLEYMNWLEYREFGLGHEPLFEVSGIANFDPAGPDYWLKYWIHIYETLLKTETDFLFLNYEELCGEPDSAVPTLFRELGLQADPARLQHLLKHVHRTSAPKPDSGLMERARNVWQELCEDRRNLLTSTFTTTALPE